MKRPGAAGRFWPGPLEEALLRTALLPEGGAAVWAASRSGIDVDHLPGELHRLMPLLARALADAGAEDPDLGRLRGVRQYTWYRNQRLFADGGAVVGSLGSVGIEPVLLRGATTALRDHRDAGLRPMNDLDLLVRPGQFEAAGRILTGLGWVAEARSRARTALDGATAYQREGGRGLVLHTTPSRNLPDQPVWWRAGPPVRLGDHDLVTLDPAAHLLHLIVDGARARSFAALRWIGDATVLVRATEPDWDVVVAGARQLHAALRVADALDYLAATLSVAVPPAVPTALRSGTRSVRERAAHRLSGAEVPGLGPVPELLGRYLQLTAGLTPGQAARQAPSLALGVLDVDRAGSVPAALARRLRPPRSV